MQARPDPTAFTVVDGASADADTEFLYQLPAPTTFDRFAVPNVREASNNDESGRSLNRRVEVKCQ